METFEVWKEKVNKLIIDETGLSCDDWPDWNYMDDYENGLPPKVTACDLLVEQGFDSFSTTVLQDTLDENY